MPPRTRYPIYRLRTRGGRPVTRRGPVNLLGPRPYRLRSGTARRFYNTRSRAAYYRYFHSRNPRGWAAAARRLGI